MCFGVWRSLVARSAGGREVAGSNPVAPSFCYVKKPFRFATREAFFLNDSFLLTAVPNSNFFRIIKVISNRQEWFNQKHFLHASYPIATASALDTCHALSGFIFPQSFLLWYFVPFSESQTRSPNAEGSAA